MTTSESPVAEPAHAPEVFPPTLREVMLRPRWIGMLLLCLVVAGVFAWLGQWQLGRALQTPDVDPGATEQVQPIDQIVQPGAYLPEPLVGQRVSVSGRWVPGDFIVVSSRYNDRVEGYWVTGQLRLTDAASGTPGQPVSLAVAVGWTDSLDQAQAAASALQDQTAANPTAVVDLTGRIIADEGPLVPPHADPLQLTRMSPAALLGRWHDTAGLSVYRPYLTAAAPLAGLTAISSPAPAGGGLNWLNIFYAIEWAVFACFAFYLWYRLARDAWEKEVEALTDPSPEAPGA
ncbi:SURF1 family cytochrome oxidase biogenesis protein [Microbacterium sp. X-17]|uniref:SURF1 family protein n=1 Tax=Microbacterium sp. X-17 TaxID=3144404 RepID=UPI0031F53734